MVRELTDTATPTEVVTREQSVVITSVMVRCNKFVPQQVLEAQLKNHRTIEYLGCTRPVGAEFIGLVLSKCIKKRVPEAIAQTN